MQLFSFFFSELDLAEEGEKKSDVDVIKWFLS